jgi:RNA polymerase sigma-70 factor (ECF subfamily)
MVMSFEELVNDHKDAVYRQMVRACGNREDAEDVLAEALLRAYQELDSLREEAAFRSWLAQIGRRLCWQLKGRESLRRFFHLSELQSQGYELTALEPWPDAQAAAAQMRQALHESLERLPPEYRAVYELRDLQELTGEEVAQRLGITLAAEKSRLHRARTLVRQYLDAALAEPDPLSRR